MVSKLALVFSLCTILSLAGLGFTEPAASLPPEVGVGATAQFQHSFLNPDFIAWRARKQAGEIVAFTGQNVPSGLVPSPFDDSYLRRQKLSTPLSVAAPSQYDLRSYGWVTPAKDQGRCGACFAFATYSSLESWLLKNAGELWDFSENHLKNYSGIDWSPCAEGGDPKTSAAYLVRWAGPVEERDDPFHDWDEPSSPGGPVCKYVKSVLWFYDPQDIKNTVMNYGALFAPMHWDHALYDPSTNTYHYVGTGEVNHAVGVIGWDDSKVVPGTSKRGAWLVKSSWGTSFGDQGCFYVSYEDQNDITYGVAYCDAVPPSSYLHNYQYDEFGLTGYIGAKNSTTCWGANVFTASADEDLAAVGFYALAEDTAYVITVYDTILRSGGGASFSNPLASVSDTARHFGYYTVALPSRVPLHRGDDFAIVVKFTTPGTQNTVPLETAVDGYSSKAQANAREGYLSTNGQSFVDITTLERCEQTSICIKGLTVGVSPVIPGAPQPLTVNGPAGQGNISPAEDVDWWYFTVSSSATYTIETSLGTLADTVIALYGPNDQTTLIEENDDIGGGNRASKITRTLSPATYYVKVRAYGQGAAGTYTIRLSASQPSQPPVPGPGAPQPLTVNGPAGQGEISPAKDIDWWSFTVSSSANYTIETALGTLTDTVIALYGPNNQTTLIEEDDDIGGGNRASRITRTLSPGTYYVKVRGHGDFYTGTYTIGVGISIVGTWTLDFDWGPARSTTPITFVPDGTFADKWSSGIWSQMGNSVRWDYWADAHYQGTLSSPNTMSGSMVDWKGTRGGTWTATRQR